MPWSDRMQERREFIADLAEGIFTFTELCERRGISRKTGYKWKERYEERGDEGLRDRPRVARRCPHKTDDDVVQALLELRRRIPRWGPKKLLDYLSKEGGFARERLPAISTAADLLKRHGLVSKRRRRRGQPPSTRPGTTAAHPNHVWTIDFKGEFRMRNRRYCYPLTIVDEYSRFIICAKGQHSIKLEPTKRSMEYVFEHFGLPEVIVSDNGTPFAGSGLARLSRLSVWWLRLGIRIERTRPATPSDNGRHERMHRELKADCTRPPGLYLKRQQIKLDTFVQCFNHMRPHEAIDMDRPAQRYDTSPRPYPAQLPELRYPGHYNVSRVNNTGCFRLKRHLVFLSNSLADQHVGWHEIDDGIWSIHFAKTELARFDAKRGKLHPGGATGPKVANEKFGKDD